MENFDSFKEEKENKDKLSPEADFFLRHLSDWETEKPSVLFTADIMAKLRTKEKPVFHRGIIWLFGLGWGVIVLLAVWHAQKTATVGLPKWDNWKFYLTDLQWHPSSSLLLLANVILIGWVLFFMNRFFKRINT